MSGLLTGDIANAIYAGFKGKLLTGALVQSVPATSGGLDQYGDPMDAGVLTTPCEGFSAAYSEFFMATAQIPEGSVKCCFFAPSLKGIRPGQDDKAYFTRNGVQEWFQLRKVKIDPAGALWVCEAFPIPDPS